MQNSSAFCRAQEALHIKRATETTLDNVRAIATAAAAAWRGEAVLAEQRETRRSNAAAAASSAAEPTDA